MPVHRLDANETAFLNRELRHVAARSYDKVFPELKARRLIPVNNEVGEGMSVYAFEQYEPVGRAKIISGNAKDIPRVDIIAREDEVRIRQIADKYGYSTKEIRASARTNKGLSQRKADAAKMAIEQKIDHVGALGDPDYGLLGLLTQPLATLFSIPLNQAGASTRFVDKSPDEILSDLNGVVNNQIGITKEAFPPNTVVLPVAQYTLIASTPRSSTSDTTILEYFLRNNPYIDTVFPWHFCEGAGVDGTDRMVCYRRDPACLDLVIPMEFTQYEVQVDGLEYEVPCEAECAGVVLYYPLCMSYGDGI